MQLGLGTATTMRLPRSSAQVALLRQAYDLGCRWFDTAPTYGLGRAEPALAEALGSHPVEAVVATKVGLRLSRTARLAARVQAPVRAAVRGRLRPNGWLRRSAAGTARPFRLNAETVITSAAGSRNRLAPLGIDTLLLHDVRAEDIEPSGLEALLELQRRGEVRRLGTAGTAAVVQQVLADHPGVFEVAQVPGGPSSWNLQLPEGITRVGYGCLAQGLESTTRWFASAPDVRQKLEDAWSGRLNGAGAVARFLVQAELAITQGVVLVGTTDAAHLQELWLAAAEVTSGRSRCDWGTIRQILGDRPSSLPA